MPIFRHGGGCTFAPDRTQRADEARGLLWRPEHLVDCVCLVPVRYGVGDTSRLLFDPARWPGPSRILFTADGLHVLVGTGLRHTARLWLPGTRVLPKPDTPFGVYIQPDLYARERSEAALHVLQLATRGNEKGPLPLPPSWPRRDPVRLTAMLQALDLRDLGLGQRDIARAVLGAAPGADWASSHERSALRRLLRDGTRYVATDHLTLLRPPIRQGRR